MKILILFLTLSLSLKANYNETLCEPWGVDSDLVYLTREETSELKQVNVGQKTCVALIHFFQVFISPIDGPRSSFYPTSSQYTLEAIRKYGVFRGIALGCDRLMRENGEPWVYDRTDKYGIERKLNPVR